MKADPREIHRFLAGARAAGIQMLQNASYIIKELPNLKMTEPVRTRISLACDNLVGTKHDLFHDIFDLEALMASGADNTQLDEAIRAIQDGIVEGTDDFRDCVEWALAAADRGEVDPIVSILLMESAVNILNAAPEFRMTAQDPELAHAHAIEPLLGNVVPSDAWVDKNENEELDEDLVEDEEDHEDNEDCYCFRAEDAYSVGRINGAIRGLLKREGLSAETREHLRVFLFAMELLPLITPGPRMRLELRQDNDGGFSWIEIRMADGELTFARGGWEDGDAWSELAFEASAYGNDGDVFRVYGFAESFVEWAGDPDRTVLIDDESEEPFTDWDLPEDNGR